MTQLKIPGGYIEFPDFPDDTVELFFYESSEELIENLIDEIGDT